MALVTISFGKRAQSSDVNQIVGLLKGTAGYGDSVALTQYSSASSYTLTVRNQNTANGYALQVLNAAGSAALLSVNKTGTQVQSSETATPALLVQSSDATNTRGLQVKDATGTLQLSTNKNGVAIGTTETLASNLLLVSKTDTATAQVMASFEYANTGGTNGDVSSVRVVAYENGTADNEVRPLEVHMIRKSSVGNKETHGVDVTVQGNATRSGDTWYNGVRVRSLGSLWAVSGSVRQDNGVFVGRDTDGWKYGFRYQGRLADGYPELFHVNENGRVMSRGHIPATADSFTLGDANSRWHVTYSNNLAITANGTAANPTLWWNTDYTTGMFLVSAGVLGVTTGGTERMRVDANGNVVIGTAALNTTATDGFLYVDSCAGTPTGTPTSYTGRLPMIYDSTNNKIYIYNGAWKATAALT